MRIPHLLPVLVQEGAIILDARLWHPDIQDRERPIHAVSDVDPALASVI